MVDKSNKENEVARNKSVISAKPVKPTPQSQIDIKLNKSRNVLEEKKNKLIKSASVTSLCVKEEVSLVLFLYMQMIKIYILLTS